MNLNRIFNCLFIRGIQFQTIKNYVLQAKNLQKSDISEHLRKIFTSKFSFSLNNLKSYSLHNWYWSHLINQSSLLFRGAIFSAICMNFSTINSFIDSALENPEGRNLHTSRIDYEKLFPVFNMFQSCPIKEYTDTSLSLQLDIAAVEASLSKYDEHLKVINSEFKRLEPRFKDIQQGVTITHNNEYKGLLQLKQRLFFLHIDFIWTMSSKIKKSTECLFDLMSQERPGLALQQMKQICKQNPHLYSYFKDLAYYAQIMSNYQNLK